MSNLQDGDFELNGFRAGDRDSVFVTGFEPSEPSSRNQDTPNPSGHGIHFGRDYYESSVWTLEFGATGVDRIAAMSALNAAWRKVNHKPGEESVLRFRLAGRERRVYGRPRNFLSTVGPSLTRGHITAAGTFVTSDPFVYGDEPISMSATMYASSKGGLKTPLKGNLTGVKAGVRNGAIPDVGGETSAPFVAVINGPVRNPSISSGDWTIQVDTTLAYDQSLTIDTRKNTVMRNDGTSLGGSLTRTSRLASARLNPGPASILFSGIDPTGTSRVTVTWHPTYYTV